MAGLSLPPMLPFEARGSPKCPGPQDLRTVGKVSLSTTHGGGGAEPEPTAKELAEWIGKLRVSQGTGAGGAFPVLPWQRDFLAGLMDPETEIAALTVARGNGKSTFLAAVAAAFLIGPAMRERADVLLVAASFRQARIIFEHALAFLAPWTAALPRQWRITDNENAARAEYLPTRARLRAVGSEARKLHGPAFGLALLDEPAQWGTAARSGGRELFRTVVTAMGKIPGAKCVALGTKAEGGADDHWFARLTSFPPPDGLPRSSRPAWKMTPSTRRPGRARTRRSHTSPYWRARSAARPRRPAPIARPWPASERSG